MDILEVFTNMSTWSIILFVIGFALVIFEMFNPGFGVPGALGIVSLIAGIIVTADTVEQGLLMGLVILVILAIMLTIVLYSASKGRLSRTLILKESTSRESGFTGTEDMDYLLGKQGVTCTPLRPAGCADLEGVRLDVVTHGEFIEKGVDVTVIEVEGNRIVVAPTAK
ncbi:MAG: NfeD family protein [Candidatus Merdivicinus sp.]|jgi:membrane-bound ClpP family serine protease